MAEWRSLIGKSGFVTEVGWENGGTTRSRRAESGASGSRSSPAAWSSACVGCGTGVVAEWSHPVLLPADVAMDAPVATPPLMPASRATDSANDATLDRRATTVATLGMLDRRLDRIQRMGLTPLPSRPWSRQDAGGGMKAT